jgi:DNA-binding transcriptional LysR family regulator
MDTRRLRHIVTVDETRSVTRAAERLGLTQSAITKSIAAIERDLGYLLFERQAHGMTATVEGRRFLNRSRRIIADLDQLSEDMRTDHYERELLLRVVICPASLEGPLSRSVRQFILKNPECRIHLSGRTIETGARLLQQGDVDICIGSTAGLAASSDFELHALPDLKVDLFVRRGHPLAHTSALIREDLERFPMIVPDMQGAYTRDLIEPLMPQSRQTRRLHIVESFTLVASVVEASDAIGIVSRSYVSTSAFSARFQTIDFNFGPTMGLSAATRKAWHNTRHIKRFISTMREYL